ncbi:MAG TPA: STAS domain-containing protein [Terracidiphilus sp.]|nr:STAS domain-containing protein [Terracidiphilus sp.]
MNTRMNNTNGAMVVAPCGLTELVRGHDRELIEEMTPVVRQQDVALDLKKVDRIDAAGISALISLYGQARDSGHSFAVANPTSHVKEILALVGLDRILLDPQVAERLEECCLAQSAA